MWAAGRETLAASQVSSARQRKRQRRRQNKQEQLRQEQQEQLRKLTPRQQRQQRQEERRRQQQQQTQRQRQRQRQQRGHRKRQREQGQKQKRKQRKSRRKQQRKQQMLLPHATTTATAAPSSHPLVPLPSPEETELPCGEQLAGAAPTHPCAGSRDTCGGVLDTATASAGTACGIDQAHSSAVSQQQAPQPSQLGPAERQVHDAPVPTGPQGEGGGGEGESGDTGAGDTGAKDPNTIYQTLQVRARCEAAGAVLDGTRVKY